MGGGTSLRGGATSHHNGWLEKGGGNKTTEKQEAAFREKDPTEKRDGGPGPTEKTNGTRFRSNGKIAP